LPPDPVFSKPCAQSIQQLLTTLTNGLNLSSTSVELKERDMAGVEKARTWLGAKRYDAVLIGAGVRLVATNTLLFEAIINAARSANPHCRFVFNYSPTSTPDDIRRWYPNPADAIPAR
jgi:hypothetical protein